MTGLSIRAVSQSFGATRAVDSVSLEVRPSELIALLGPSGCGKTTLLRMIAGFIPTREGRILVGSRDITVEPPHKRNTGMVFQSYALFPHMTVAENIAFGLRMRGLPAAEQQSRVADAVRLVRLDGLTDRYPRQLSGGQQQRVAIARVLAIRPEIFLLDEPLSNLDAKLRYSVGLEIRALQQSLGLTTVFVTHDQNEALALADRLVLMDKGKVIQSGTAAELYTHPANVFVANFVGRANLLAGKVEREGRFSAENGIAIACDTGRFAPGARAMLCVRPENVRIGPDVPAQANSFPARLEAMTYLGSTTEATFRLAGGDATIVAHHQNREGGAALPRLGQDCSIGWLPEGGLLLQDN